MSMCKLVHTLVVKVIVIAFFVVPLTIIMMMEVQQYPFGRGAFRKKRLIAINLIQAFGSAIAGIFHMECGTLHG